MTFRSMAKGLFRVVFIALACVLALNVMVWALYFGVRLATTSYSVDWVVLDKVDRVASWNSWCPGGWEDCRHFVHLKDGRKLAIVFDRWGYRKPRRDRYMLEIRGGADLALLDESVRVNVSGREGTDMRIELHRDSRCPSESGVRWLAVFPNELTPRKEGESLEIRFSVRAADSSSEINEIKLVFRSFSVCHYFNIFTDIT
ncbi:MAG: hypothetical protein IJC66_13405 [Kiritimatiellae bacterium]|nr:hypothetical protein [Kiritimatiellia bacterium]